jgi:hypothetical protein
MHTCTHKSIRGVTNPGHSMEACNMTENVITVRVCRNDILVFVLLHKMSYYKTVLYYNNYHFFGYDKYVLLQNYNY